MPVTVTLLGYDYPVYNLAYGVAIIAGGMLMHRRLLRRGYPPGWCTGLLAAFVVAAVAGAWLSAVVQRLAGGGGGPVQRSAVGSLVLVVLVVALLSRRAGLSTAGVLDAMAVPLPLMQAIGRVGCFAAGCCSGRRTDSWLALVLPGPNGVRAPRYPAQLLAAGADLTIFAGLLLLERRRPAARPGTVALAYLAAFSLKRLAIGFVREEPVVAAGLSGPQLASAVLLLAAVAFLVGRTVRTVRTVRTA